MTVSARRPLLAGALLTGAGLLGVPDSAVPQPEFRMPLECQLGSTCFIQNYPDLAPGSTARDPQCGPLTYDGHGGTDFRVATTTEMARGIPVKAAAEGTVHAVRDGMPDGHKDQIRPEVLKDHAAGNGVLITHGNDWQSQYSHLQLGSVSVSPGDRVAAGQRIGRVGLSGNTEFPHLEFTVRHDGQKRDPFTGARVESGCQPDSPAPLWSRQARQKLDYRASGILATGFANRPPTPEGIVRGRVKAAQDVGPTGPLIFYVLGYGLQENDRERILLRDPKGRIQARDTAIASKDQAQWVRYAGYRAKGRPAGTYTAVYRLWRQKKGEERLVHEVKRQVTIGSSP